MFVLAHSKQAENKFEIVDLMLTLRLSAENELLGFQNLAKIYSRLREA